MKKLIKPQKIEANEGCAILVEPEKMNLDITSLENLLKEMITLLKRIEQNTWKGH